MFRQLLCFASVCAALWLASCSVPSSSDNWTVDLLHANVDTIDYSTFVDSVSYIPLEVSDECLVGKVTDVILADGRLFVFDDKQQEIWMFNSSGKYLGKLGSRGEGPGEYFHIAQVEYDRREKLLAVLTFKEAPCVLYYALDGTYVKSVELGIRADDFKICPDGGFILSCAGRDTPSAGVYVADAAGGNVRPLVKRAPNHLVYTTFEWELCSYNDVICFQAPVFANEVYHWQGDSLQLAYPFRMIPELSRDYEATVSLQHMTDYIRTNYVEGERWIYATYWSADPDRDLRVWLYSKSDGKSWVGKGLRNDMNARGSAAWTSFTDGNVFVLSEEPENPDDNPVIRILHLK